MEPNLPTETVSTTNQPIQKPQPKTKKNTAKLLMIIGGGGVLLLIALALGLYFFIFAERLPRGPKLLVGSNPYVYSCSAFEAEIVAKQLGLNGDKSKQTIDAIYAYAPANQQDKELDLVKLTGDGRFPDTCDMEFDVTANSGQGGSVSYTSKSVSAEIAQYKDAKTANDAYKRQTETSSGNGSKALGSYKDNSVYYKQKSKTGLQGKEAEVINSFVNHKNMIISLTAALPEGSSADDFAPKIDALFQEAIKRIEAGSAAKPKAFTNHVQFGGKPLVDACYGLDYVKLAAAVGNIELRPDQVASTQNFLPLQRSDEAQEGMPKSLESSCTIPFRTQQDKEAAKDLKLQTADGEAQAQDAENTIRFSEKFPHTLGITLKTFENAEAAKQYVKQYTEKTKKQAADKKYLEENNIPESAIEVEETNLGEAAVKVNIKLEPTEEQKASIEEFREKIEAFESELSTGQGGPALGSEQILQNAKEQLKTLESQLTISSGTAYYIANGQYVYFVTVGYVQQTKPFKTAEGQFTDAEMKKVYDILQQFAR